MHAIARGTSPGDVFARTSVALHRLVAFDAAAWMGTDPATGLPTSPVRVDGLDGVTPSMCADHWQHELLDDDVNLFRELARQTLPAAALRARVGDPLHSRRYRRFLSPLGLDDELRAVLRAGDASWGTVTLWRRDGAPPFTAHDTQLVASLAGPVGEALRRLARPADVPLSTIPHDRPGLVLFDEVGQIVSINAEARAWLAELPAEPGVPAGDGVELPLWMLITMFRANAVRHGGGDGTARTRVRSRSGRWFTCHGSCLRRPDGTFGHTAIVIEPARPAAIAPIVSEAYDLTEREQQIIQHIDRGADTAEIARELFLSPHTVRDHVKAIFAKARVSSRGELVAKLFAEFYEPLHQRNAPLRMRAM
jgi:DNA-binding CsgD family transcriptional regulator